MSFDLHVFALIIKRLVSRLAFRFDVAGVHPKSKTPGTITQVFHDKKAMGELVSYLADK